MKGLNETLRLAEKVRVNENQQLWDTWTGIHVDSSFYDVQGFLDGAEPLRNIELGLLTDVQGKRLLHLQCHFGRDSLVLAQQGARVVGVDFSEPAIVLARRIAQDLQRPFSTGEADNVFL